MNDIRFVQKYNNVLLDNFDSVLKQNMIFQTKIGLLEEELSKLDDIEKLKQQINILIQENNDLRNTITANKHEADVKLRENAELHRLQTALNKQAKELSVLQKNDKEQKVKIRELEKLTPRVKKQTPIEEVLSKEPIEETKIEIPAGTF